MAKITKKEQKLFDLLKLINISTETYRHEPLYTGEESQKLRGKIPGTHCKTLFLKDKKKNFWLVIVSEEKKMDLNSLAKQLNVGRFSFCPPEIMKKILDVEPGSVTPFSIISDNARNVNLVLDREMLKSDKLNYHPLHNEATTTINGQDLIKFISYFKNPYKILEVPKKNL
jgi:Ala-tRNA(Pro) deacylase